MSGHALILRLERTLAQVAALILPRHLMRNPDYFGLWERRGYHVTPVHYYSPVPDVEAANRADQWGPPSSMAGIDLRENDQIDLLGRIAGYGVELADLRGPTVNGFTIANGRFESGDAEVLYAMLRILKPARVVEVGAGFSTLVTDLALAKNAAEGVVASMITIDPNLETEMTDRLTTPITGLSMGVQEVDPDVFTALGDGDVLFIDSTHVLRQRSDVQVELLEIIPRLPSGVMIHIHDIFLPFDYPEHWLRDQRRFFNEQYLLQAFLSFNDDFEVVWAGAYMAANHPEKIEDACPLFDRRRNFPGSFWIRRVR